MSTALVLDDITTTLNSKIATALNGMLTATDIVVKSPQFAPVDKICTYIYHVNRNPHYINTPEERVSPGRYRAQILVIDVSVIVFSTFSDPRREMNYMENIADELFREPSIVQADGPFENVVKLIPKVMGLDELNKFWSMFSGKSQALAHFYQLSPVYVFPKTDILENEREVQPISQKSNVPNIILNTKVINDLEE
jgi:hypothetical protein